MTARPHAEFSRLALLKLQTLYFPAGEDTLVPQRNRHTRYYAQKMLFLHLADSLHIAVEVSQQLVRALEPKKDIQSNWLEIHRP